MVDSRRCNRCSRPLEEDEVLGHCTMCWDDDEEKVMGDRLQSFLTQRRKSHTLPDGRTVGRL